jgi:hypothetical protein
MDKELFWWTDKAAGYFDAVMNKGDRLTMQERLDVIREIGPDYLPDADYRGPVVNHDPYEVPF